MNSLGVYLLVSLFFVVATMFEFAIVLLFKQIPGWKAISKIENTKLAKQRKLKFNPQAKPENEDSLYNGNSSKWNDRQDEGFVDISKQMSNFPATHKIDITALFLFSVIYLLFNLTYWLHD